MKGLLLAALLAGFVGCASKRLAAENKGLKADLAQLNNLHVASEAEVARITAEKNQLEAELDKVRQDYAARTAELEEMSKKLSEQGFDVSVRAGMVVITMPQKVLYGSGSATISTGGKDRLRKIAEALNGDFKTFSVEIQGHTDTDPIVKTKDKYKSNWELSYARAQTVAYYLMTSGKVDPKRVHVSAYGEYHPVASNATSSGKATNRRVEILVIRPAGS